MEETLKLLSEKLGTTTEYLWGVLLRQAPIEATIGLIQVILIITAAAFSLKIHINISKKGLYYEYEEILFIPMFFIAIILMVLIIRAFFEIHEILIGYFNPEYWALKEILDAIKK